MKGQIGVIGLTELSFAFIGRLLEKGFPVAAYDEDQNVREQYSHRDLVMVPYLDELAMALETKRIIFIFQKKGRTVDTLLEDFVACLSVGDVIIDFSASSADAVIARMRYAQGFQVDLLDAVLEHRQGNFDLWISGNRFAFNYCETMLVDIVDKGGVHFAGTSGHARAEFNRQQGNLK
jgi:6-phosphogluconate dehydrogenase (decarboxylating)